MKSSQMHVACASLGSSDNFVVQTNRVVVPREVILVSKKLQYAVYKDQKCKFDQILVLFINYYGMLLLGYIVSNMWQVLVIHFEKLTSKKLGNHKLI